MVEVKTKEYGSTSVTKRHVLACDYPIILQDAIQHREEKRSRYTRDVLKKVVIDF